MATAKTLFLLHLLAFVTALHVSSASCPTKCTCRDNSGALSVLCHDPSMGDFPSPLPPETAHLEIKGTYSHPTVIRQLKESDLKGLRSLKTLTISHTMLDSVEEKALQGQDGLVTVDLSFNKLTKLPASVFSGLSSLAMLHLTGNEHLSLPRPLFQNLPNLQELYLGDLSLSNLDLDLFSGLDSLVSLDLSNNQIKDIPTSIASPNFLRGLHSLDLSYNQLSSLTNTTAPLFTRVPRIALAGNPWDCTCELQWMQKFTSHIFPAHQSNQVVTCRTPEALTSRPLAVLRSDQLICIAPQIESCDPVSPQPSGVSFQVRCTMSGVPFPFVSWKTADGAVTIGSSRGQTSPYLDVQGHKVTLTLLARAAINGTLTIMAQNIYGMGRESIPLFIQPSPPTTTTTTPATTSTPTATKSATKESKEEEGGGGGGMITYIAAGGGGAALLISAIVTGVACRKINSAKIDPEEKKKKRNDDDDGDGDDDEDVEEMDYGRESVGGGRPPTASRPMSAWDV